MKVKVDLITSSLSMALYDTDLIPIELRRHPGRLMVLPEGGLSGTLRSKAYSID